MAVCFFDSSGLVKLHVHEAGSALGPVLDPRQGRTHALHRPLQMVGVQKNHSPNSCRAASRSASRIFRPSSSTIFENSRPVNMPAAMRQSLALLASFSFRRARFPRGGGPSFPRSVPTWWFSAISDDNTISKQTLVRSAGFANQPRVQAVQGQNSQVRPSRAVAKRRPKPARHRTEPGRTPMLRKRLRPI